MGLTMTKKWCRSCKKWTEHTVGDPYSKEQFGASIVFAKARCCECKNTFEYVKD